MKQRKRLWAAVLACLMVFGCIGNAPISVKAQQHLALVYDNPNITADATKTVSVDTTGMSGTLNFSWEVGTEAGGVFTAFSNANNECFDISSDTISITLKGAGIKAALGQDSGTFAVKVAWGSAADAIYNFELQTGEIGAGGSIGEETKEPGITKGDDITLTAYNSTYDTDEYKFVFYEGDNQSFIIGVEAVSAFGDNNFTYQWYQDGNPIGGATQKDYYIDQATADTSYYCVVSNNQEQNVTSVAFTLSFIPREQGGEEDGAVNVQIEGNGGTFTFANGDDVRSDTEGQGLGLLPGTTLEKEGWTLSDLEFWTERGFDGWEVYKWGTDTNDQGETREEFIREEGVLLDTEELLAYKIPETDIRFRATWSGSDYDYGSDIFFECYGGMFTWYERGNADHTETTDNRGNFFREDGTTIYAQTQFTVTDGPVRDGFTFEGWLQFNADNGNLLSVADNGEYFVYTTEEAVKENIIPSYNVRYVAKWEEISIEEYLGGGSGENPGGNSENNEIHIQGNGGVFTITVGSDSLEFESFDSEIPRGVSLADLGAEISDPVFWEPSREFAGWIVSTLIEVDDGAGNSWLEPVQITGTDLMSSEALTNYTFPEEPVIIEIMAQWADEESAYYTDVFLELWGGNLTILMNVEDPESEFTIEGGWGNRFRITDVGKTLDELNAIVITAGPAKENDVFEGWLEFKILNNEVYVPVSDTLYTTEQVMKEKPITAEPTAYMAKWESISLTDYGIVEVEVEELPVIDPDKPVEEVTVGVDGESTEAVLTGTVNTIVSLIKSGYAEELKKIVSSDVIDAIVEAMENDSDLKITATVNIVPLNEADTQDADVKADMERIKAKAGTAAVAQFLDLNVEISAYVDGVLVAAGNTSSLFEQMSFTVAIPEELKNAPEGYKRTFFILHAHDGEVNELELEDNGDGTASFYTDEFSVFALAYEDTLIDNGGGENPGGNDSSGVTPGGNSSGGTTVGGTTVGGTTAGGNNSQESGKTPSAPATGDTSMGMLWMVVMVLSLAVVAASYRKLRRSR